MDFLFRSVSEKEKEEIKKQAREILDNFSKKISGVESKIKPVNDLGDDGKNVMREEGIRESCFIARKIMFENAREKNRDFIVAEKGGW